MANDNPKNDLSAYRFKKGVSGNPGGKPKNPSAFKMIRRLSAADVAEIGTLIVSKNITKLKEIITDAKDNPDSKHSALKVWMATVAVKGTTKGDAHALDLLLNRLVGRVTEKIQLEGSDGPPIRTIVGAMTREERVIELERLRKARKEAGQD